MRRLALLLLTLAACAPAASDDTQQDISGACYRSFRAALEAWEGELGRVPEECAYLDSEYSVQLLPAAELPCDPPGPGERVNGCTEQPAQVIYLLGNRSNVELVDTSVHEWIHAIAQCVDGEMDVDHVRVELWETLSGAESVEIQAQAAAQIGQCL